MNENFVIEWLKIHLKRNGLSENSIKPVLYFSLMWNLFEYSYFTDKKKLTPELLLQLCREAIKYLSDEKYNIIFSYFKNRYFPKNIESNKFKELRLETLVRKGNILSYHDYCKNSLLSVKPTAEEKICTILLIIHRFRNNLFHGRKNPRTLNLYGDVFNRINEFLSHFIESTKALYEIRPAA